MSTRPALSGGAGPTRPGPTTTGAALRAARGAAIGLSAVALLWWWRGRPVLAVLSVAVAFGWLQVAVVHPATVRRVTRILDRLGHRIAAVLSVVVLGVTWLVIVVPVALLNRLLRIDLLDHGAGDGWTAVAEGERARRPWRREAPAGGPLGRRVVRVAVVVAVLGLATAAVVDHVTRVAPPPLTPFGERSTEAAAGDVHRDHWATTNGTPVSRSLFPGEPWGAEVLAVQEDAAPCDAIDVQAEYPEFLRLSTRYVNVVAGRRRTTSVRRPEHTVWLFGGSTTYGIGQRDEGTIPSALVRLASERGARLEVLNLGCPGKVNWAETVEFEAMLRAGLGPPDVAVFLDGINEWNAAFSREVFGLLDPSVPFLGVRSLDEQDALLADARGRGHVETHDPDRQMRLAAAQYRRGVERARALGERYGVPVVHFWQPALFTMPVDAPGNPTVYANDEIDPATSVAAGRSYREAAERSGVEPIDLMDIFDDASQPLFFDCCHTNEAGARLEAAAMYPYVAEALGLDAPAPVRRVR